MDENTLLLEYALAKTEASVGPLPPNELTSYELPSRTEIEVLPDNCTNL